MMESFRIRECITMMESVKIRECIRRIWSLLGEGIILG